MIVCHIRIYIYQYIYIYTNIIYIYISVYLWNSIHKLLGYGMACGATSCCEVVRPQVAWHPLEAWRRKVVHPWDRELWSTIIFFGYFLQKHQNIAELHYAPYISPWSPHLLRWSSMIFEVGPQHSSNTASHVGKHTGLRLSATGRAHAMERSSELVQVCASHVFWLKLSYR